AGDAETLRGLRKALPPVCRLVTDAQAWWRMGKDVYSAAESDAWIKRLTEHEPVWLAEPFHPDEIQDRQRILSAKTVPIAAGEYEASSETMQALSECGVDVLQVNVAQLGGLFSSRSCLQFLADHGWRFVLTGAMTPLEVVALAHLATNFSDD